MLLEATWRTVAAPTLVVVAAIAAYLAGGRAPIAANDTLILTRDVSWVAAAFTLVTLGIRHIRRGGIGLTTVIPLLFGAVIFLSSVYFHSSTKRFFESGVELAAPTDLQTMNQNADAIITDPTTAPERRASVSRLRARMVFVETGEVMPVIDETGRELPFSPTEDDLEQRSAHEQLRVLMPLGVQRSQCALYLLGAAIVVSLLLGLFTPVRRAAV